MALTWAELESVTDDYFAADDGKAVDIYFYTSFLLNYLIQQQKGLWIRPPGGNRIRVPLEYDGQESGFFSRGDTLSSDDRESVNAAYFDWKHGYGNATIYNVDQLKNAGEYAQVELLEQRVGGAQKSLTKLLADSIYDEPTGDSKRLTGLRACCHETTTTAYGDIQEADLVANDGTTPWEGKRDTTAEAIDLDILRDLRSEAKTRDGKGGRPDLIVTTETLWNELLSIIQVQQRFVKDSEMTAKVGFTGVDFEGSAVFADDYCPSGYAFAVNSMHYGFAVHQRGYYVRSKWEKIPSSPEDRAMKIYFHGNAICNNRKAHKAHSNLTT